MAPIRQVCAAIALACFLATAASSSQAAAETLAFGDSETPLTICRGVASADKCIDPFLPPTKPGQLAPVLVPIKNTRAFTSLPFQTTVPGQRVFITFNAQCQVKNTGGYNSSMMLSIAVDGFVVRPQSGNSNFCASYGIEPTRMSTRIVTYGVPAAGTHYVTVTADLSDPGPRGPGWFNVGSITDSITKVED